MKAVYLNQIYIYTIYILFFFFVEEAISDKNLWSSIWAPCMKGSSLDWYKPKLESPNNFKCSIPTPDSSSSLENETCGEADVILHYVFILCPLCKEWKTKQWSIKFCSDKLL